MNTIRRYSTASNVNHRETTYSLMSKAVLWREKAHEFHDLICKLVGEWHHAQLRETLGIPSAILSDGRRRVVLVPGRRETVQPPNRAIDEFDYVVHSDDGGKTWRVLDLGCVDDRWSKEIFPKYSGKPPVHGGDVRFEPL